MRNVFRDIYFGVNCKWFRNACKEYDELGNIDRKYYCSNCFVSFYKCGVKCGTSLRFWGNKDWVCPVDPYGWFQWYFRYWSGRRSLDDERQINRRKGIVSRLKGKLIKMINDRFDDYSISP